MFDPLPVLKNVKVPVLALNGELDLQVAWKENLDLIGAGLKAGENGDVTVKAFPKLNHLFQNSKTGLSVKFVRQAARVLGISMTELLGDEVQIKRARKTGPTGKVHKVFEEVSKLPRRQQEKIVEVVTALVNQYGQTR